VGARRALAVAVASALCSCAHVGPNVVASRARAVPGAPVFAGAPPAKMVLDGRPLDVDPSGAARYLVRARFEDAAGRPTDLVSGGDVEFVPSTGSAQWQTRLRYGAPAAIVSSFVDGPITVRVHASVGAPIPDAGIATDTRTWTVPRVVARALGPHAVWVGWFPRATDGEGSVVRNGDQRAAVTIAPGISGYIDETVAPGHAYAYRVSLADRVATTVRATAPAELAHGSPGGLGGKGVWLSFSPSTLDGDGYDKLKARDVVLRAVASGLRSVDVRTAYGPYREITSDDASTIDAVIDGLAAHRIAAIAWTVPRSASFEDLEADVAAARYRTPNGNHFAALAVDLERGDYFLGNGRAGYDALATYLTLLRAAVGPRYPIVATVEDPNLEHLTEAVYPFAAIARAADVLQPMVYWRLASRRILSPKQVAATIAASQTATLREAGRTLPVNVGMQTAADGPLGAPAAEEIAAAVAEAKASGAIGVTFFDWGGTPEAAWSAIANARW
jgi:hypothetical protein